MTHLEGIPKRTFLYTGGQVINLTCAVMSVTMAAVVGSELAPFQALATVPYGMQFVAVLMATYPTARVMDRAGRAAGFRIGSVALCSAGIVGWAAITMRSFVLLILCHVLLGLYIASANYNRFAATDGIKEALHSKVIALVVCGGLIAALIAPIVTAQLRILGSHTPYSMAYLFFSFLGLMALALSYAVPNRTQSGPAEVQVSPAPAREATDPTTRVRLVIAFVAGGFGYGTMNLLMMQASLQMQTLNLSFNTIDLVLQVHVLAMFAPSLAIGGLIAKLGRHNTILAGYALLLISALVGTYEHSLVAIAAALTGVGIAWNFLYVTGGALLVATVKGRCDAVRWQGINDTAIALAASVGALSSAFTYQAFGWENTLLGTAVISVLLLAITRAAHRKEKLRYVYAD